MSSRPTHMRRRALASAAALIVIASMASCSSGSTGSNNVTGSTGAGSTDTAAHGTPTTITFSYLWGGKEASSLEKIIADFNASQDEVVVKGVSSPDFQKQLTSMSAAKGSFDISDNFGNTVGSWASKGILAPLDDYIKTDGIDLDDFVGSAMSQMKYDGKVYALPIALHSLMLVYNKKLFAAANLEPPATMDDLAKDALALTKTDADGNITQLGLGETQAGETLTNIVNAFGGSWWGSDGEPTPTNPGNVKAMEWYQSLVKQIGADKIAKFVAGYGQYLSDQDPFYTGKIAMRLDGEWTGANAPASLDWGAVSIPYAEPQYKDTTQVSSSILFIPANSQHKDAAAKFLEYMMGKQPMTDFTVALGNLPARTSLLDDTADYASIPQFSAFANALKSPTAFAPSSAPDSAQYTTDLNTALDSIANLQATPQAALNDLASRVKSYAN